MVHWSIISLILCKVLIVQALHNGRHNFESEDSNNVEATNDEEVVGTEKPIEMPMGFTCGLCIVVDEEFCIAYKIMDETTLKVTLHAIVDQASWIFRSTDWNEDGIPENIGFKITSIAYGWKPYKYETATEYETPKIGFDLLKLFAKLDFDNCCLGVGFTNRPFLYGLDGIAFGASNKLLGGICDHRTPKGDEPMKNMNVALISGRGFNASQLTPSQITRAFVHSLGHSFGVHAHDNEYNDPQCWGFGPNEKNARLSNTPENGRYLMWTDRSRLNGIKNYSNYQLQWADLTLQKNTLQFSSCSKASVMNVLESRKKIPKCLEFDYEPYCGNGIVEGLELCDCGNEFDCMEQSCCGSRQSKKPCSIANIKGCPTETVLKISETTNHKGEKSSSKRISPLRRGYYITVAVVLFSTKVSSIQ